MNLSRALTSHLSTSSKHRLLQCTVASLHSHLFSTKASQNKRSVQKKMKLSPQEDELRADPIINLKRPIEIPFQPRSANTVQLIGTVGVPVEKQRLSDGRVTAVSVLVQEKYADLPKVWIPVIFQGELAEVAASYLKENDTVYITGQLNGHTEPVKVNEHQANVQVLAHTLNYVVDSGPESYKHERDAAAKLDAESYKHEPDAGAKLNAPMIKEKKDSVSYSGADIANDLLKLKLWTDLLDNPNDWIDCRAKKIPGKNTPDFTHILTKKALWISKSTPNWVISKLEEPPFSLKKPMVTVRKANHSCLKLWDDVVANPQNWNDNRMNKQNGVLKATYPDFKNKITNDALWIDSAPSLILQQLDQINFANYSVSRGEFCGSSRPQAFSEISPSKNGATTAASKDALWKDLVDNPESWYDNRSNKFNPKSPDFKHKETGEALWITSKSTPQWALEKLPSERAKRNKSDTYNADSDVPTKSFKTTLLT